MRIIIIEDEKLTAEDLADVILQVAPDAQIVASLRSVKQSLEYLGTHPLPDLLFCDIQLGDGLSFEIFKRMSINVPVIFCTAYDEYAMQAFKSKGIEYVLKPFTKEAIRAAVNKYKELSAAFSGKSNTDEIQKLIAELVQPPKSTSILVNYKEKIIPIKMDDIALFYIQNHATHLYTLGGKSYFLNKTLDQIEQTAGRQFFRANRQFLVNRSAVKDAAHHLSRKFSISLTIPFEGPITVSKEKLQEFMDWLAG